MGTLQILFMYIQVHIVSYTRTYVLYIYIYIYLMFQIGRHKRFCSAFRNHKHSSGLRSRNKPPPKRALILFVIGGAGNFKDEQFYGKLITTTMYVNARILPRLYISSSLLPPPSEDKKYSTSAFPVSALQLIFKAIYSFIYRLHTFRLL